MNDERKRKEELINELVEIRQRMAELNRSAIANKLAEEELMKIEERYRNLVELSPDMIALHNREKYVYMNPAGIKMLGASGSEDLIGRSIFELIHPECLEMARERVRQLEQGNGVALLEEKYIRFDGRIVDVEVAAAPIPFQGESMVQVIARDITDRKQAEAELRKSEEEAQRLAHENAVLAEMGRIISSSLTIEEVYKLFSGKVKSLLPYDRISINLINEDGSTLIDRYVEGDSAPGRNVGDVFPLAGTLTEMVIQNRKGLTFDGQDENEVAAKYPGLLPEMKVGFRSFLSVPLISRDQPIGGLHFRSKTPGIYLEKDLQLAESIATQIAGAIANNLIYYERKRAEETLRKSEEAAKRLAQENAILAEIGQIISSTLNIDEVYELFSKKVKGILPFDWIAISLMNKQKNAFINRYVKGDSLPGRNQGEFFPIAGSFSEKIIQSRKGIVIGDKIEDEVVAEFPSLLVSIKAGFRSFLSVPLISTDQVIGALHFRSKKSRIYSEKDLKLAESIAHQIAGAIANAQLFAARKQAEEALGKSEEEALRLVHENATLAAIGRIINSTLDIENVYERFAELVKEVINFDRIMINVNNLEKNTITVVYSAGADVPGRRVGEAISFRGSINEEIVRTHSSFFRPGESISELAKTYPVLLPYHQVGLRSEMAVPLISQNGVIGVLHFQAFQSNAYTQREMRFAEEVANQIAGAIAIARLYGELKEAKETLQKKEEEFRELYDHAPLGYHEYNKEGKITRVNQTDLEMLGYTAEEMIGQPMWKFNVEEELAKEQILAKLAGRLPPGKNLVRIYRRKDGSTFPVLIEDRLIKDERGEIIGIRCTIQDITERKRAEEALQQSEKELKEQARELQKELIQRRQVEEELARSNKELGQFAYVASHDLQEPLRMVTSYVQLLARHYRGKLDGDADEFIGFAVNGAARMQQLINDLLTYSRVGTKGREFEPTDCEIVLQQSLKNLQIAIEEKQAIVSHDPLPTVMADNVQLGQLFQNLIGNAIKFQGTEPPQVHVSASRDGNGWVFSVRDNGIGIAPEYAERIFVIFQRLHSLEKYPGTGIGLAVCKKIVERHGGRIWVESESGKGAIFYFTLPGKGEQ